MGLTDQIRPWRWTGGRSWIAWFLIVLGLSISGASAQESEFEVTGDLVSVFSRADGSSTTNSRAFRVSVSDCQFFIHVDPSTKDRGIEYSEFASDGTNSFDFVRFVRRPGPADGSPRKKGPGNDSTLVIRPFSHPSVADGQILPLWLAYGSSCFFSNRKSGYQPAMHLFLGSPLVKRAAEIELKGEWRQSKERPYALEFMVDYLAGRVLSSKATNELEPEFATGATNSIFLTTSWTNVSGMVLPLQFMFTEFGVDTNASPPRKTVSTMRIEGVQIRPGVSIRHFEPALADSTRVIDYRYVDQLRQLAHGGPAEYIATNKALWSIERIIDEKRMAIERGNTSGRILTKQLVYP